MRRSSIRQFRLGQEDRMKPLFSIPDKDTAVKVIGWYASGRGIRVWKSHDLGANRPDLLTPADSTEKPHWAYCSYVDVTPEQSSTR